MGPFLLVRHRFHPSLLQGKYARDHAYSCVDALCAANSIYCADWWSEALDSGSASRLPARTINVARAGRACMLDRIGRHFMSRMRTSIPCSPRTSPPSVAGSLLPKLYGKTIFGRIVLTVSTNIA